MDSASKTFYQEVFECLNSGDDFEAIYDFIKKGNLHLYYKNIWRHIFPECGRTMLMMAAKKGRCEVCRRILLADPYSVNIKSSRGYTALHYSAFNGYNKLSRLIIKFGGDVFSKNMYSETVYESALSASHRHLHQELSSLFLSPGPSTLISSANTSLVLSLPQRNVQRMRVEHMTQWQTIQSVDTESTDYLTRQFHQDLSVQFRTPSCRPHSSLDRSVLSLPLPSSRQTIAQSAQSGSSECEEEDQRSQSATFFSSLRSLAHFTLKVIEVDSGGSASLHEKEFDCFSTLENDNSSISGDVAITIGRRSCNTVTLSDLSVSNFHAKLQVLDGIGLFVTDVGSKHGTYVDKVRVRSPGETSSTSPDVGKCVLVGRIQSPDSILRVGRISLSLVRKQNTHQPHVYSKGFRPNQQLGRALEYAVQADDVRRKQASGRQVVPRPAAMTAQERAMMEGPKPSLREIGQPRASFSSSFSHSSRAVHVGVSCPSDERNEDASSSVPDIESEEFVGRSLLKKMGWQEGVKLGRVGGTANAPIEVRQKRNRLGLGATGGDSHTS